jgi:parallel beta-helix repeat protein
MHYVRRKPERFCYLFVLIGALSAFMACQREPVQCETHTIAADGTCLPVYNFEEDLSDGVQDIQNVSDMMEDRAEDIVDIEGQQDSEQQDSEQQDSDNADSLLEMDFHGEVFDADVLLDTGHSDLGQVEFTELCVNEFMPRNSATHAIGASFPDWIELHNNTIEDVSLAGWWISDDAEDPMKHDLAEGLVVPAGGELLLYADNQAFLGEDHLRFNLESNGESIFLTSPEGRVLGLEYPEIEDDFVARRVTPCCYGEGCWVYEYAGTPGESNPNGVTPETAISALPTVWVEVLPDTEAFDWSSFLFSNDYLPEFQVELSVIALNILRADPYQWVEGTVTFQGVRYSPVGVRCKGENSLMPVDDKCSLKIDFNRYADYRFLGLKEITFQNMVQDSSSMKERLAYELFQELGLASARSNHAWVDLNGAPYGLFTLLDSVDDILISRWFEDSEGSMFEVNEVEFTEGYVPSFELEFGPDNRSTLYGTAAALENSGMEALNQLAEFMNVEQFNDFWATGAYVGHYDGYPTRSPGDDAHVYHDLTSDVLHWVPHGMDEAFEDPFIDVLGAEGLVFTRCIDVGWCRADVEASFWDAYERSVEFDFYGFAQAVRLQIAPYVAADPNNLYGEDEIRDAQVYIIDWIRDRRSTLETQLGPYPGTVVDPYKEPTELSGRINVDMTLTQANSPYIVDNQTEVSEGVVLSAEPGVEIWMGVNAQIQVKGGLLFEGTEEEPILIRPEYLGDRWRLISLDDGLPSTMRHVTIFGTIGGDPGMYPAAISSRGTDLTLEHMLFQYNEKAVYVAMANLTLTDSVFDDTNTEELVNVVEGEGFVSGNIFGYLPTDADGVDFDGATGSIINNIFLGGIDDGIDIGEGGYAYISGNLIVDFVDKSLSVGEGSSADIVGNIFVNNGYGIAVKDTSYATIDHNTFYNNTFAVSCYEKDEGLGGGFATVSNSIMAGSLSASYEIDELSEITFTYSLSDTDDLPGENNLRADPMFQNPYERHFNLSPGSPCIDGGDPASEADPDGSTTDIGAIPYSG